MKLTQNEERINGFFEELVPVKGKCESLAGEIIRATARIGYRYYNDGDMVGVGYGKETCNPAARFLLNRLPSKLVETVVQLWGERNEMKYEKLLDELNGGVADYIENHPELRLQPTNDMLDFRDSDEDVDDGEDEEY